MPTSIADPAHSQHPKTRSARRSEFSALRRLLIDDFDPRLTIANVRKLLEPPQVEEGGRRSEPTHMGRWAPGYALAAMASALEHAERQITRKVTQSRRVPS